MKNQTGITQLNTYKVKVEHNNKNIFLCSSKKWANIIRHARYTILIY